MEGAANGGALFDRGDTDSSSNNSRNKKRGDSFFLSALYFLAIGLIVIGPLIILWGALSTISEEYRVARSWKDETIKMGCVLFLSGTLAHAVLTMCVRMCCKRSNRRSLQDDQDSGGVTAAVTIAEEQAQCYPVLAVPTYEEAVGWGQYPVHQSNHRPDTSQPPSYSDLFQVDGVLYEYERSEVMTTASAAGFTSSCRPGEHSAPAAGISIEPITPPPKYEDKWPPMFQQAESY